MIELHIPGRGDVQLSHAVFDVNGTLATDGVLIDGVADRIAQLSDRLTVHLLTADTHGKQFQIDRQLGLSAERLKPGGFEREQGVHARFLAVVDGKGRDCRQDSRNQPGAPAKQGVSNQGSEQRQAGAADNR